MEKKRGVTQSLRFLLIGPYDPYCGEYTFLAPPLGVWRLAGTLRAHGIDTTVFDPNCCDGDVEAAFEATVCSTSWDLIGVSTTAMTLRYDLALAHAARRLRPQSLLVAGGMEATFLPERTLKLGPPFDLIVLGEGEKALLEIAKRLRSGERTQDLAGVPGTALLSQSQQLVRFHQQAMDSRELFDAIQLTPYDSMPYGRYWRRLEQTYGVGKLPFKAEREARLSEIRSVRLITLNYCPMGCSFCSSTNYLHEAQGSVARVARLNADECLDMIQRIVATHPSVRTIVFQDDIFVFNKDARILPLCEKIIAAKLRGELPQDLQFISTNRIDALNAERLAAMRRAGFRVLGFGIENFSARVLEEFNKRRIHRHIDPVLAEALQLGITPFLDLILTSPRSNLEDLSENVRRASHWLEAGCEIGIYPYIIPFSGAAMSQDETLVPHTVYEWQEVPGTQLRWRQATKILPADPETCDAILAIEEKFERLRRQAADEKAHLPSRVRSVMWLQAAREILAQRGQEISPPTGWHIPMSRPASRRRLRRALARSPVLPAIGESAAHSADASGTAAIA